MNTFNKFLVILMALMLISFWVTAILLIWLVPDALGNTLRNLSVLLRAHNLLFQILLTTFGVSTVLVSLLILAGEFSDHEPSVFKIATPSGAVAFVPLESLAQRLKNEIESSGQVHMARVRLRPAKDKLDVLADVAVAPDTGLATKLQEIEAIVRGAAQEQLGVPVRNVRLNLRHAARGSSAPAMAQEPPVPVPQPEILVPDRGAPERHAREEDQV